MCIFFSQHHYLPTQTDAFCVLKNPSLHISALHYTKHTGRLFFLSKPSHLRCDQLWAKQIYAITQKEKMCPQQNISYEAIKKLSAADVTPTFFVTRLQGEGVDCEHSCCRVRAKISHFTGHISPKTKTLDSQPFRASR